MPQFRYTARNSEGKLVDGLIDSRDRADALLQIEQQRYFPIKVESVTEASARTPSKPTRTTAAGTVQTLPLTHQFLFTEQLGHLLGAGMTLDEALGILEKRLKQPKLQSLSQALHQALVDGRSLSQAMRDYPKIFSPLYVNMVSAGEASGSLSEIMRRLVTHLADVKSLRDRVQQALVYPAVLVVAGIGLIIIFMTVMVPQLSGFFAQTGQALPLATRILLEVNHLIVGYWWVAVALGAGVYTLFKFLTRDPAGRNAWDYFRWRIPGYGHIMRYRLYAQFARTLGTLVENGVTLLKAMELLEEISGNEWVRLRMVEVRRSVIDGAALSVALRQQKIFPELMLDMMAIGEQTGRFGETMQMIADVYERELDKQVKITSTLIPPVIMIVIAAVVGLVVFGILSAVFNLTSGLRTRMH
ncbi:MAG: ral secretion pathway protein [Chthoniobacter sp.]|jgi:type II secretory pathway component PulF|nr:ral secretion pathway protein [Chthoniobacter sp.]